MVSNNHRSIELLRIVFGATHFGNPIVELWNIGTTEDIGLIIRSLSDQEREQIKAAIDKLQNALIFANGCTTKL